MELLKKGDVRRILLKAGFKSNGSAYQALCSITHRIISEIAENMDGSVKIAHSDDVMFGWAQTNKSVPVGKPVEAHVPGIRPETLQLAKSIDEFITLQTQIECKSRGRILPLKAMSETSAGLLEETRTETKELAIQIDEFISGEVLRLSESFGSKKVVKSGKKRHL